ncbi:histidine phosphatase superfamily [Chytriomyces sp. MP71]|nr:histidine phosphatase superfamily [Chytriomyces sp. MP71]
MDPIATGATVFTHEPKHRFSLFLARQTKIIHSTRHAEGKHNEANAAAGSDAASMFATPGAWKLLDAKLTVKGVEQCVAVRAQIAAASLPGPVRPQLVVVSPFTRTLQTAHVLFGGSQTPFLVHEGCRERAGLYTCDKRRSKTEIVNEMAPLFAKTGDLIDFDSFGFFSEADELWTETRESSEDCTMRAIQMMEWLASRPEREIAVVTHSSWLKHLFRSFGHAVAEKDKQTLHRLAGNAEVRSICLALHRGFYPPGEWVDEKTFVPEHPSFRRYRYAPTTEAVALMHKNL